MAMNLDNVKIIEVNNTEEHTEQPSYYSVIPANVRYDSDLSPYAILLYGEITALTHKNGYCYASNTYFAKRYDRTPQAVSKWINQLADKGYINIVYCRCKNIIIERRIYITSEVSTTVDRVSTPVDEGINQELIGYQQRIKENNKYNNKTNNKISSDKPKSEPPRFINSNNEVKKSSRSKKPNTQQYEEYISSLTDTEREQSAKCVDLFIELHKQLDPQYNRDKCRPTWQVAFVEFHKESNRSYEQILQVIRSAMTNPYRNDHIYKPEYIFNNFEDIVQSLNKTNPKSNYQKKRDGAIERSNMITDNDDEYKVY